MAIKRRCSARSGSVCSSGNGASDTGGWSGWLVGGNESVLGSVSIVVLIKLAFRCVHPKLERHRRADLVLIPGALHVVEAPVHADSPALARPEVVACPAEYDVVAQWTFDG